VPIWQVQGDQPRQWLDYNQEFSSILEEKFRQGAPPFEHQPGARHVYTYDVVSMLQVNKYYRSRRVMRRLMVDAAEQNRTQEALAQCKTYQEQLWADYETQWGAADARRSQGSRSRSNPAVPRRR
jgi:hypothetical protein